MKRINKYSIGFFEKLNYVFQSTQYYFLDQLVNFLLIYSLNETKIQRYLLINSLLLLFFLARHKFTIIDMHHLLIY